MRSCTQKTNLFSFTLNKSNKVKRAVRMLHLLYCSTELSASGEAFVLTFNEFVQGQYINNSKCFLSYLLDSLLVWSVAVQLFQCWYDAKDNSTSYQLPLISLSIFIFCSSLYSWSCSIEYLFLYFSFFCFIHLIFIITTTHFSHSSDALCFKLCQLRETFRPLDINF